MDMFDPPFFVTANIMRSEGASKSKKSQVIVKQHLGDLFAEAMKQFEKKEASQLAQVKTEQQQDAKMPEQERASQNFLSNSNSSPLMAMEQEKSSYCQAAPRRSFCRSYETV